MLKKSTISTVIEPTSTEGSVNISLLFDIAKQGIPFEDHLSRFYYWEIALMILPKERAEWHKVCSRNAELYSKWLIKYFSNVEDWVNRPMNESEAEVRVKEFGLSDNNTMEQIHGDLVRTPDSQFYEMGFKDDEIVKHKRRIERILYIFSCFNAYSYVQGFNELIIPIYYVSIMANRLLGNNDDIAEACAFQIFQNLMIGTGLGDLFTLQDFASVMTKFDLIKEMCKITDKELFNNLFAIQNAPQPCDFAFSWVSLLFTQIYNINNLIMIWDRLLSKESNIVEFGMAIATAHLILLKPEITNVNSNIMLKKIHEIHDMDPSAIIAISEDIMSRFHLNI